MVLKILVKNDKKIARFRALKSIFEFNVFIGYFGMFQRFKKATPYRCDWKLWLSRPSVRCVIGKNGRRGRKSGLGVEWIVRPFYQRYHKSHVDRVTRSIFTRVKFCVDMLFIRVIGQSQKIQFKYEKVKFYDLLNGSMELVFQKIQ